MYEWYVLLVVVEIAVFLKFYLKVTTGRTKSHVSLNGKTALVTGANSGRQKYIFVYKERLIYVHHFISTT